MKISPVSSTTTMPSHDAAPAQSNVQSMRLKMNTNFNPTIYPPPEAQGIPGQQEAQDNTAAVEQTQPLSPQLALLARQKRELQKRQRELETRERAIQERPAGSTIELARLKSEPLRVLLENGVTYDQLTEAIMSGQGGNSEVYALKKEIESLKQGIDQKFTDQTTQQEKQVLAEMQREAQSLVNSSDDYELVRINGAVPQVMRLIEQVYKEEGQVLDMPEALKLVEEELLKEAEKIAQSKKLQSRFSPVAHPMQAQQQRQTGMRTLTNRDTASVPMSAKQRALAAFYGNLKR